MLTALIRVHYRATMAGISRKCSCSPFQTYSRPHRRQVLLSSRAAVRRRRRLAARRGPNTAEAGGREPYFRRGPRPTCWRRRVRYEPRTCTRLRRRRWWSRWWVDRRLRCTRVGCEHSTWWSFHPTRTTSVIITFIILTTITTPRPQLARQCFQWPVFVTLLPAIR